MVANGGLELASTAARETEVGHCGEHCPFLNRSDHRCGDKLRLDHIDHAFDYCFGDYKACSVYLEQLAERRVRRLCGLLTPPGSAGSSEDDPDAIRTPRRPLVQLTVAAPHTARAAHADRTAHADRYPQRAA